MAKVQISADETDQEVEVTVDGRWQVTHIIPGRKTRIVLSRVEPTDG